LADIWAWMTDLVTNYGYLGAFFISTFGNFTVFFPVPFVITIYAFGATLNPLLLGFVCGLGSTVGEFSAYLIGSGGRRVLNDRYGNQLETAKKLIEKYGATIIFLLLGMMRFDLKKAMAAMFAGKFLMCTAVAYAGKYSYDIIIDIFASSGWLGGVASTVLMVLVIYAMLKIDWTKFIDEDEEQG